METKSTRYDGMVDVGGGSGLLVGDRFVLTNSHVLPPEDRYQSVAIAIRLKTRTADPIRVVHAIRDPDRDLALLELNPKPDPGRVAGVRCPMPAYTNPDDVPVGSRVFLLGYPVDQDMSVTEGLISNHSGQDDRWQTSLLINAGNSGGPAFRPGGVLAGLAVGGVTSYTIGDETLDVDGVNFIIPVDSIRKSPLFQDIQAIPEAERCWVDGVPAAPRALAPVPHLNLEIPFRETRDTHPVVFRSSTASYGQEFPAQDGYRITGCEVSVLSANHSTDPVCTIAPDGKRAALAFDLTSGPAVDRWRGWLAGTVRLTQTLTP